MSECECMRLCVCKGGGCVCEREVGRKERDR